MNITDAGASLETPPLREGDHLNAEEFHRRYEAMPELKNARLIDGVVHMSSPMCFHRHGRPHSEIHGWLYLYSRFLPGIHLADNTSLRVDDLNEPQPDLMLFLDGANGGASWFDDRGFVHGVPDLIVEVAGTTAREDAGEKRALYESIGVREFILWRTIEQRLDWWHLVGGTYQLLPPDEAGVIRSVVFPGLWLYPDALIGRDARAIAAVIEAGLASEEHQKFAATLRPHQSGDRP